MEEIKIILKEIQKSERLQSGELYKNTIWCNIGNLIGNQSGNSITNFNGNLYTGNNGN